MLRVAGGARPLPYLFLLAASAAAENERTILAGRYGSAPLPAIAAYFEHLAKAGAVTLSP